MYAVIETGGKQYLVKEGDIIKSEFLNITSGKKVDFFNILMIIDKKKIYLGNPVLSGSSVNGIVIANEKNKKINILKFKRRKHYMKKIGHRQLYTKIKIEKININVGINNYGS